MWASHTIHIVPNPRTAQGLLSSLLFYRCDSYRGLEWSQHRPTALYW